MAVTQTTIVSVPLPEDLARRLEAIAKKNERKRTADARIAIREYVERIEAEEAKAAA